MTYQITANNKEYTVSYHAAQRMLQRFISEEMMIITLEHGTLIEQTHGIDLYEYEYNDDSEIRVIRVTVDEDARVIVTVIEESQTDE